jgi:hypothetical protein
MTYCLISTSIYAEPGAQVGVISGKDVYAIALLFNLEGGVSRTEVMPLPIGDDQYIRPGFVGTIEQAKFVMDATGTYTRLEFVPTKIDHVPELRNQETAA